MSVRASTWAWEMGREKQLGMGPLLTLLKVADHADNDGICWPGEKQLAEYTVQGERTVRRHLKQLEGGGLLSRERRQPEQGDRRARDRILLALDLPANLAGRSEGSAGQPEGGLPANGCTPTNKGTVKNRQTRARKSVAKKPVTDAEHSLATAIVAAFNEIAGTSLSVDAHLTPIVGRIRERPKADAAQHRTLIEAVFAGEHWWTGPPSPRVIYGNAGQFEQSIELAREFAAGKSKKPDPLGDEALQRLSEREAV